VILAALFLALTTVPSPSVPSRPAEDPKIVLTQILAETRELGGRPGEDFIKHEFFIGGADDDDTNKDTSVAILIQTLDGRERMTIQVTRMERDRRDPRIKTARDTKTISGALEGTVFRITRSDYSQDELESLCSQILRAVRDKKRLMKGLRL
jgi:hypothetical protein